MTRGISKGRNYWIWMTDQYRASGLNQRDFARRKGISIWTLKEWIARLKREAGSGDDSEPESLDDILVAAAKKHGFLKTGRVTEALGITRERAREYLQWLVEEGRLRVKGSYRWTKYLPADGGSGPG